MERAQPFERIRAGTSQLDVVADNVLDADTLTDGGDIAIGDPASHRLSLRRAGSAARATWVDQFSWPAR